MKLNAKLYLKIIGILLLLTPFAEIIFGGGAEAFMKGYNNGRRKNITENINLIPKDINNTPLNISTINGEIIVNEIKTTITTKEPLDIYPFYIWPIKLILGFTVISSLILIFLIIRRLIYNRLLEKGTPKYMALYGISIITFSLLDKTLEYIKQTNIQKYLVNTNYTASKVYFINMNDLAFALILFAFAIAVNESIKLKEENDLTI